MHRLRHHPALIRAAIIAFAFFATPLAHAAAAPAPVPGPPIETGQRLAGVGFDAARGVARVEVQCIDGYKFVVAALIGHQANPSPSVAVQQVYEDVGGRVIPARCAKVKPLPIVQ